MGKVKRNHTHFSFKQTTTGIFILRNIHEDNVYRTSNWLIESLRNLGWELCLLLPLMAGTLHENNQTNLTFLSLSENYHWFNGLQTVFSHGFHITKRKKRYLLKINRALYSFQENSLDCYCMSRFILCLL